MKNQTKSFNLGKAVKKWRQQGKSFEKIAVLLQETPNECIDAFNKYMGLNVRKIKSSINLETLITKNKKIHLYGSSGVGKSFSIEQIAEKLGYQVFVSFPRSEEDLAKDFGDGPFIAEKNIFVIEGDAYYWKKYGLVKRYIEASKTPLVIITNGKNTPTKNITKLLTQVKMYPPTRADVAEWLKSLDGKDSDVYINLVYDKDWRKVIRNYSLKRKGTTGTNKEKKIEAKQLAYLLLKGTATAKDFENCRHPLPFVLTWLGWNTPNFYTGERLRFNMELISWVDVNKHMFSQSYLINALLRYIPTSKKGNFYFPPFKRNKTGKEVKQLDYEISKYKKKKTTTKPKEKKPYKSIADELGDLLLI